MEDSLVVREFFKDLPKGRFLEIGANNGNPNLPDEPVWSLLDLGWSGVYCEPNPESCAGLIKNVGPNRPDVVIVNCAIAVESGMKKFYSAIGKKFTLGLSSLNNDWINYLPATLQDRVDFVKPILTNAITFKQLLDVVGTDFDLLSIDIENTQEENDNFIQSIDFSLLNKCRMIVVESITDSSIKYIEQFGFQRYISNNYKHSEFNFFFVKPNIP